MFLFNTSVPYMHVGERERMEGGGRGKCSRLHLTVPREIVYHWKVCMRATYMEKYLKSLRATTTIVRMAHHSHSRSRTHTQ